MALLSFMQLALMILFYGGLIGALIYLIIRRIHQKGNEDFEDRDN